MDFLLTREDGQRHFRPHTSLCPFQRERQVDYMVGIRQHPYFGL